MDSARDDDGLPPGCTVVERNPFPALAISATAGLVTDADDKISSSETGGIVGGSSVVLTSERKRPSTSSTTQPRRRAYVEHGKPKKALASAEVFGNPYLDRTVEALPAHHGVSVKSRTPSVPSRTREVRYNPGPTFRKARGRKKKALLDSSEVTKDNVIGVKELNVLLRDVTLQQVNK